MLLELIPIFFILLSSCLSHPMGNALGTLVSSEYIPSSSLPDTSYLPAMSPDDDIVYGPRAHEYLRQERMRFRTQSLALQSSALQSTTQHSMAQQLAGQQSQERKPTGRQSPVKYPPRKSFSQEVESRPGSEEGKRRQRARKEILE